MSDDKKQPNLSWSAPAKPAPVAAPQAAPAEAPATLGFPSNKKAPPTHAPMYASFLVAGIIIGVLLATAQTAYNQRSLSISATSTVQSAATTAATSPDTEKTTPTEAPLLVAGQPAGSSVVISGLNIARPTWAVVYVSREGKPGNALGARLFFAGDKEGRVGLLRNTVRGQSYFVGLSVDNGDGAFSLSKDKPLADADGGPLWATFRAQ